jgi:hypothetical protein
MIKVELLEGEDVKFGKDFYEAFRSNIEDVCADLIAEMSPEQRQNMTESELTSLREIVTARVIRYADPYSSGSHLPNCSSERRGNEKRYALNPSDSLSARIEGETARADSLRRYLAFELPDEDDCTCEKCTAAREFKEQSGFDVRVNAAIVPGNDDGPTAMITDDTEKMREIEARALAVQPIPAWRCSACKAVIELKKECPCGCTDFTPWCLWICSRTHGGIHRHTTGRK